MFQHVTEVADESQPLTDDEKEILEKLREHIGEEGQKQLTHESQVRYVRGYAFEAKNAKDGMSPKDKWLEVACAEADKTIAWRKEIDANTLETRKLDKWDVFKTSWVSGVFGTDNQGHPIIVERFEDFKLDRILMFKEEDLVVYQARNMEYVQRRKAKVSEKLDRSIYKHVYILDCAGLGMDVMKARAHVQVIFHVAQYYYPETLWRMFVTNAPMVFRMIWSACSMWIHPITRQKIKVLGGKALKELKSHGVEEHQIPSSIGGSWTPNKEFEEELKSDLARMEAEAQTPKDEPKDSEEPKKEDAPKEEGSKAEDEPAKPAE